MTHRTTGLNDEGSLETCQDHSLFIVEPSSGIGVLIANRGMLQSSPASSLPRVARQCLAQGEGTGFLAA